ncbi:NAD dependent epimerase/dehydratase [Xylariomycetidae sp. FL2044]|nr:NAD dependent epimerase/dehydratase [Xylariomycetidae sp. FL2044]
MAPPKVLLTGATGYIGGTILNQLALSTNPTFEDLTISVLVRGEEKARKLKARYGDRIACINFQGLDDIALITEIASHHDIIINAASGFHPPSAEAMVRGLAERKAATGRLVWMLHTSGCSNISDRPITGIPYPDREWDDANADAVYEFEKMENDREWYPQRASELIVLDTSSDLGVNALSIHIPNIFGEGEGLFQNASLIVPIMMGYVLSKGYAFYVGDKTACIDNVHISDLAALYLLCMRKILEDGGKDLPTGKAGIIFATNGRVTLYDVAQGCLDAAFDAGILPDEGRPKEKEIREVDLAEAATTTAGNLVVAECGWAGHRLTKGTIARKLGWIPTRGEDAWRQGFHEELQAALAGKRGVTIGTCINDA